MRLLVIGSKGQVGSSSSARFSLSARCLPGLASTRTSSGPENSRSPRQGSAGCNRQLRSVYRGRRGRDG